MFKANPGKEKKSRSNFKESVLWFPAIWDDKLFFLSFHHLNEFTGWEESISKREKNLFRGISICSSDASRWHAISRGKLRVRCCWWQVLVALNRLWVWEIKLRVYGQKLQVEKFSPVNRACKKLFYLFVKNKSDCNAWRQNSGDENNFVLFHFPASLLNWI